MRKTSPPLTGKSLILHPPTEGEGSMKRTLFAGIRPKLRAGTSGDRAPVPARSRAGEESIRRVSVATLKSGGRRLSTIASTTLGDKNPSGINRRTDRRSRPSRLAISSTDRTWPETSSSDHLRARVIHDDIEDGSSYRRGQPTLHAEYGTAIAINAGDAMSAVSARLLLRNRTACNLA